MQKYVTVSIVATLLATLLVNYSSRSAPSPAEVSCLPTAPEEGNFVDFKAIGTIYAMGLTYAKHIQETGSDYNSKQMPPVFIKAKRALNQSDGKIYLPTTEAFIQQVASQNTDLAIQLKQEFRNIPPLLDYEVELGLILLEDVTREQLTAPNYAPKLGYFLANDITSRSYQLLGGQAGSERLKYWGVSKSFPGFLPVGDRYWVPDVAKPNSLLCVTLKTEVNGVVRQERSTRDLIYTPKQMLGFVLATYPDAVLRKGDVILTGTPEGVNFKIPAWQAQLGKLLKFSPIKVLKMKLDDDHKYLQSDDVVTVSGGLLGKIQNEVSRKPQLRSSI